MKLFGYDHHQNRDPWDDAPHWALELQAMLSIVLENQEIMMSQADDLNNAVTSLATGYSALHDAVQVETDALTKALATVPQPDPASAAAITTAIANISAITGKMATDAAALTASIPAATTVAAPVVTPPADATVTPPVIATPPVTDPSATPPSTPPASATTN